jgi:hypothetical protein
VKFLEICTKRWILIIKLFSLDCFFKTRTVSRRREEKEGKVGNKLSIRSKMKFGPLSEVDAV